MGLLYEYSTRSRIEVQEDWEFSRIDINDLWLNWLLENIHRNYFNGMTGENSGLNGTTGVCDRSAQTSQTYTKTCTSTETSES
jgi:hypothetical protein